MQSGGNEQMRIRLRRDIVVGRILAQVAIEHGIVGIAPLFPLNGRQRNARVLRYAQVGRWRTEASGGTGTIMEVSMSTNGTAATAAQNRSGSIFRTALHVVLGKVASKWNCDVRDQQATCTATDTGQFLGLGPSLDFRTMSAKPERPNRGIDRPPRQSDIRRRR
jgi:hypothetical protein